jgi:ClpP class serine protease
MLPVVADAENSFCDEAAHSDFMAAVRSKNPLVGNPGDKPGEISIRGVLAPAASPRLFFQGIPQTVYSDINAAITKLDNDPKVETIVLKINSPGGSTDGLFETMDLIRDVKTPVQAIIGGKAFSAAYGIASQADEIIAANDSSSVGAVGIVVTSKIDKSVVSISSTKSPKKVPDVTTEVGKSTIREYLDQLHDIFVDRIGKGRGVEASKINADYGQGGLFLAKEALSRGMIDKIQTSSATNEIVKLEENAMDLNALKVNHPDIYEQVFNAGIAKERDRVSAHVLLGEASGSFDIAAAAIQNGDEMTALINAKYQAAAMNKQSISARQLDAQDVELGALETVDDEKDWSAKVAGGAAEIMGLELEASDA